MTNKKAIKLLKHSKPTTDTRKWGIELCEACDVAIEALEKQTPKKPDRASRPYKCPNCGSWAGVRSNGLYLPPYCCMCGQAIDWSNHD